MIIAIINIDNKIYIKLIKIYEYTNKIDRKINTTRCFDIHTRNQSCDDSVTSKTTMHTIFIANHPYG